MVFEPGPAETATPEPTQELAKNEKSVNTGNEENSGLLLLMIIGVAAAAAIILYVWRKTRK